jgi:hypothetical protein
MKKLFLALAVAAATTSALAANYIRLPAPALIGAAPSHPAVGGFGGATPEPEKPVVPPEGSIAGIAFGSLQAGSIADLDAVLRNTGEVPLGLNVEPGASSISGDPAFSFVSTSCAATLAAADSCAIKVRYTAPAQAGDVTGLLQLDTTAGLLNASLSGSATSPMLTYSLGAGGAQFSRNGGATTFTYAGVTVTANGGSGGSPIGNGGLGGNGIGGTARISGGGGGSTADPRAGGGGAGIAGGYGKDSGFNGGIFYNYGGNGAEANDFGGLQAAVVAAKFVFSGPGLGAYAASKPNGGNASGFGAGGGGGFLAHGTGGHGGYGGGGGGASGGSAVYLGGNGGQGVLVLTFADSSTVVLTSGTGYTPTKVVKRIWAIGAGGAGASSTVQAKPTPNGGGGGAGGGAGAVVYQDF